MSFRVDGGNQFQYRFATEEEANAFCNDYIKQTKVVLGVFADSREPNRAYPLQPK